MLIKFVVVSDHSESWFAMENTAAEAGALLTPGTHLERWAYPILPAGGHGTPTKERVPTPRPRRLTCAVCGAGCIGRQWWNRDTGYGICPKCPAFGLLAHGGDEAEVRSCYGVRGYHFDIPGAEDAAV